MTSAATELPKVARGLQRGIAEMLPRGCGINQWPRSVEKNVGNDTVPVIMVGYYLCMYLNKSVYIYVLCIYIYCINV